MVERGLAKSRSQAQSLIIAGRVYLDNSKLEKPGSQVARDVALEAVSYTHLTLPTILLV